jgi:hypothetical protein
MAATLGFFLSWYNGMRQSVTRQSAVCGLRACAHVLSALAPKPVRTLSLHLPESRHEETLKSVLTIAGAMFSLGDLPQYCAKLHVNSIVQMSTMARVILTIDVAPRLYANIHVDSIIRVQYWAQTHLSFLSEVTGGHPARHGMREHADDR